MGILLSFNKFSDISLGEGVFTDFLVVILGVGVMSLMVRSMWATGVASLARLARDLCLAKGLMREASLELQELV